MANATRAAQCQGKKFTTRRRRVAVRRGGGLGERRGGVGKPKKQEPAVGSNPDSNPDTKSNPNLSLTLSPMGSNHATRSQSS